MSIRGGAAPLGPVHVRLTSLVRGDDKGPGIGIVNAPTAAEATAELHRVARVAGADKVVSVASDYRRAALAGGTTSTQWRIEVQAWGTAMAPVKVEPSEEPEDGRDPEAAKAKAKDQDAAKKVDDAKAAREDDAQAKAERSAAAEQAAVQQADAAAVAQAAPDSAPESVVATDSGTPPPSAVPTSER